MNDPSLVDRWRDLGNEPVDNDWPACSIDGWEGRLARTPDGGAALIVEVSSVTHRAPGLQTSHIVYDPLCRLSITTAHGTTTGQYAALICDGGDPELVAHFLRLAQGIVPKSGVKDSFDAVVRRAFELFRHLSDPPQREVQGLWGELLIVAYAAKPEPLLTAWHNAPGALHDFVAEGVRLEVKTSIRGLREHEFSLDQLLLGMPQTTVVSLITTRSPEGMSVWDLLDVIEERIQNSEASHRVRAIVIETLGAGWRSADDLRFDVKRALSSLLLVRAADVPRVPDGIPPGVRRVRFTADLSHCPTVEGEAVEGNALLTWLLPVEIGR